MMKKIFSTSILLVVIISLAVGVADPGLAQGSHVIFLPLIQKPDPLAEPLPGLPVVNTPFFSGDVDFAQCALFWFGRVTTSENYVDVRLGYNAQELVVNLEIFDRRLWYDTSPTPDEFSNWDSASLYLGLDGQQGAAPSQDSYWFDGQLSWWEGRDNYEASYRGSGSGWAPASIPFSTTTGWRGGAPNDSSDDNGWAVTFHIPFAGLGLSSPPPNAATWALGVRLNDRDESGVNPVKSWPGTMDPNKPVSWGALRFGIPGFTPPVAHNPQQITIRQGLNGASVVDGEVGGGAVCGEGLDWWTEWGSFVNPGGPDNSDYNIQNQSDVADWPCFSKVYMTFPLNAVPAGKVILSASLVLHQMGSSGGGDWGWPDPSYIQVFIIHDSWQESTLAWNNAPQAWENFGGAWVEAISFPGWPGIPREWDVSRAVSTAYSAANPLSLALYEADDQYHSGKYFVSSDTQDWNQAARPTLFITYGDP